MASELVNRAAMSADFIAMMAAEMLEKRGMSNQELASKTGWLRTESGDWSYDPRLLNQGLVLEESADD